MNLPEKPSAGPSGKTFRTNLPEYAVSYGVCLPHNLPEKPSAQPSGKTFRKKSLSLDNIFRNLPERPSGKTFRISLTLRGFTFRKNLPEKRCVTNLSFPGPSLDKILYNFGRLAGFFEKRLVFFPKGSKGLRV